MRNTETAATMCGAPRSHERQSARCLDKYVEGVWDFDPHALSTYQHLDLYAHTYRASEIDLDLGDL